MLISDQSDWVDGSVMGLRRVSLPPTILTSAPLYHPDDGLLRIPRGYAVLTVDPYEFASCRLPILLAGIGCGYTCSLLTGVDPVASMLLKFLMEGILEEGRIATWDPKLLAEWMRKAWGEVRELVAIVPKFSSPMEYGHRYQPPDMVKWVGLDDEPDYVSAAQERQIRDIFHATRALREAAEVPQPSKRDLIQILGKLPNSVKLLMDVDVESWVASIYVEPDEGTLENSRGKIPDIDHYTEQTIERIFNYLKGFKRLVLDDLSFILRVERGWPREAFRWDMRPFKPL